MTIARSSHMRRVLLVSGLLASTLLPKVEGQTKAPWTWEQVRERFENTKPRLLAAKLSVDESKAQEITAHLRPNPDFNLAVDGTQIAPAKGVWQPLAGTFESPGRSYLFERQHKRDLRWESAKQGTLVTESNHADLRRTL